MTRVSGRLDGWVVRTLFVVLANITALFAVRPMVSYRALELGATPTHIGLIAGSYAALAVALAVPVGRVVDRVGEAPLMIVGPLGSACVALSLMWIDSLVVLGLSQAVLGFTHLCAQVGIQTLLGNAGNPAGRDARYGGLAVVASLGQMIGPVAAGGITAGSETVSPWVFGFAAGCAFTGAVFALTLLVKPPAQHERRLRRPAASAKPPSAPGAPSGEREGAQDTDQPGRGVLDILRIKSLPQALFISIVVLASNDVLIAYLPVYGEANDIPVAVITTLLSIRAGMAMLSRVVMLPMIRRLGRKRLLRIATFAPGLAIVVIPLTTVPPMLMALIAVAGFFLGLGQPMTLVWFANQVPAEIRGTALAVRMSGGKFGQMLMPVVVGAIAGVIGVGAVFATIRLMLASGSALLRGADLDDPPSKRLAGSGRPTPPPRHRAGKSLPPRPRGR